MSVKITNRQYRNPFTDITETEAPDWLLGNTGDFIDAVFDMEAAVEFIPTMAQPITINYQERLIKLNNGKKWSEYGFDINRTIKFQYTKTIDGTPDTQLFDVLIVNVQNDTMEYALNTDMDDIGYEILPTDRGNVKVTGVKLYDDRELQGVRLKYSNIPNEEIPSHTLNSIIDGTTTEAVYVGLDSITDNSWKDMELIGLQSGMSINKAQIRKIPTGQSTLNVDYNVVSTNPDSLQLPYGKIKAAKSFGLNKVGTPPAVYQNSSNQVYADINVASSSQMFLYDSDFSGLRNIRIKTQVQHGNFYLGSATKDLVIILRRWSGGSSLNLVSTTELQVIPIKDSNKWKTFSLDETITIDINNGDSLSLDYMLRTSAPTPFGLGYVQVKILNGIVNVQDIVNDVTYKRKYQIRMNYIISSFWNDIQEIREKVMPDYLRDDKSLSDNISVSFHPEWNNPNVVTTNDMADTERIGNSGWFNENYNGLTNRFTIKSVTYLNGTGLPVQSLSFGEYTRVKVVISGVNNLVDDVSRASYGFIWIPNDETDYKNKLTPFHYNTKINTPENQTFGLNSVTPLIVNGYSNDGAFMVVKNVKYFTIGTDVVIDMEFEPNAAFKNFFESREVDRNYALWVSVEDSSLVTNFSDRVNLLADVNVMEFHVPVVGVLDGVTNRFLEHPELETDAGVDIYNGFLEDDILSRTNFSIKENQFLENLTLGYEVENTLTGVKYSLEKFPINVSNFIQSVNGQQINYDSIRGYKMGLNDNKNWVKVLRNTDGDTTGAFGYLIYFAQKIRWEYWLQRFNVPAEFFDSNLPFNGFNNDWLHFLNESPEHKINFYIYFDIRENGKLNRYVNIYPITFSDYDSNDDINTTHNYFDSETNADLNQGSDPETGDPLAVLLMNKPTRVEIIYTKVSGDLNLNEVYSVTKIEIDKGAGVMEHRQLSSVKVSETGNILIPLPTETKLKLEQVSSNSIKATCLIDNTRLEQGVRYKITGRIGCFNNDGGAPIDTRIYESENYEPNYE